LPEGAFRLTALDVGQGLAVVIETRHYTLVYDTGPRFTDTADAGNRIIAPFLRAAGLPRIDGLIVSHQDIDHAGGMRSLLTTVPTGWFASSLYADHAIMATLGGRVPLLGCNAGQQWTWDLVRFTMLHPTAVDYADARAKTNDRSCVVRIDSAFGSALLTGDIEAISEMRLVARDAAALRAQVMLVPHHGSRTSSTPAFIRAVGPTWAIVNNGYRNRFGHPRAEIMARYRAVDSTILRTDVDGAVSVTFAAGIPLTPVTARKTGMRYWHDRPDLHAAALE
ncbi:MAG: ComEC/Rec2 family competence protein, partial [Betaproteobacteria bacterium]